MIYSAARRRLQLADAWHLDRQDDDNDSSSWNGRINNLSVQLIGVGTVALVGTCIRVWAGMDVIQAQINNLAKSDNQQDARIEQLRAEVNTMRVQIGVVRAIMVPNGGR